MGAEATVGAALHGAKQRQQSHVPILDATAACCFGLHGQLHLSPLCKLLVCAHARTPTVCAPFHWLKALMVARWSEAPPASLTGGSRHGRKLSFPPTHDRTTCCSQGKWQPAVGRPSCYESSRRPHLARRARMSAAWRRASVAAGSTQGSLAERSGTGSTQLFAPACRLACTALALHDKTPP